MSAPNLNDLQTQSGGLHALLHMLYEASCDLDYASDNAPAVAAANRVNHLIILARDEAERLDAAVGECITADRKRPTVTTPTVDDEPIFEIDKLSMEGLFSLYDALRVVNGVISGLACQPRFTSANNSNHLPPHGDMLQKLGDYVSGVLDDIHNAAVGRKAVSEVEKERKAFFLVDRYVDGLTDPAHALDGIKKELGKLVGGARG